MQRRAISTAFSAARYLSSGVTRGPCGRVRRAPRAGALEAALVVVEVGLQRRRRCFCASSSCRRVHRRGRAAPGCRCASRRGSRRSSRAVDGLAHAAALGGVGARQSQAASHRPSDSKPTPMRALFISSSMSLKPSPRLPISCAGLRSKRDRRRWRSRGGRASPRRGRAWRALAAAVGGPRRRAPGTATGRRGRRSFVGLGRLSVRAMTMWYLPWPEVMKIFWPVTNQLPSRPARRGSAARHVAAGVGLGDVHAAPGLAAQRSRRSPAKRVPVIAGLAVEGGGALVDRVHQQRSAMPPWKP
jgi:hypothetical protein